MRKDEQLSTPEDKEIKQSPESSESASEQLEKKTEEIENKANWEVERVEQSSQEIISDPETTPEEKEEAEGLSREAEQAKIGLDQSVQEAFLDRIKSKKRLSKALKRITEWGLIVGSIVVSDAQAQEKPGEAVSPKKIFEESGFAKETAEILEQNESLKNKFGPDFGFLLDIWNKEYLLNLDFSSKELKERPEDITVSGFEKLEIDSEMLKKVWQETYPKNWVITEIDSIDFQDKLGELEGEPGDAIAHLKPSGTTTLDVFKPRDYYQGDLDLLMRIDQSFAHESGHANDWDAEDTLSPEEKKQLFIDVTKRYVQGEDRLRFVEEMASPQSSISEYWARICESYFTTPSFLKEKHPGDYDLVDQWVKKQDPEFDPEEALHKRFDVLMEYVRKKLSSEITGLLDTMEAGLRGEIEQIIERYLYRKEEEKGDLPIDEIQQEIGKEIDNLRKKYETQKNEDLDRKLIELRDKFLSIMTY